MAAAPDAAEAAIGYMVPGGVIGGSAKPLAEIETRRPKNMKRP